MVTRKSWRVSATRSSQGVRQLSPRDDFASAPGGSDSTRKAAGGGGGAGVEKRLQLGADPEHAQAVRPHATIYATLLMGLPQHEPALRSYHRQWGDITA